MFNASFYPRLTKAECEFWFEAGADWEEQTERRMEAHLVRAFPDVGDISEPFLWFEPNYLAILSGPLGDAEAHTDVRTHSDWIARALAAYRDAAHPRRVETLVLNYQFEFEVSILPRCPRRLVWNTPREMITLEPQNPGDGLRTHLALRCLIVHPPAHCLTHPQHWLERIHRKMDGAFHELRQAEFIEVNRK